MAGYPYQISLRHAGLVPAERRLFISAKAEDDQRVDLPGKIQDAGGVGHSDPFYFPAEDAGNTDQDIGKRPEKHGQEVRQRNMHRCQAFSLSENIKNIGCHLAV